MFGIFFGNKNNKKKVVNKLFPTQRSALANARKLKQDMGIIIPLYVKRVGKKRGK